MKKAEFLRLEIELYQVLFGGFLRRDPFIPEFIF